ncbi:hypothetical protein [Sphingomonas bacterium]|uniref:hypothetical protein n=1 Tax=Sphingomonas bacterium TaxID=1895847 RepID=UPI001575C955|nr:hypothetical protein [Sphingomonas bacterium]
MFHLHLLTDSKIAALKAQGHSLTSAAGSGLTTAITLAAQTGNPIGAAALAAVDAAEASGKSGPEKRADAIAAVAPIVVAEAAKGSFSAVAKDAETFAGLIVEEVVASMKRTPAVLIGEAVVQGLIAPKPLDLSAYPSAPAIPS